MSTSEGPADPSTRGAGDQTGLSNSAPSGPPARSGRESGRGGRGGGAPGNMLPDRPGRRFGLERLFVRLIATSGIVGVGVAMGAILAASKVQGWIIGLVIAAVSVVLSAILWSSRQL